MPISKYDTLYYIYICTSYGYNTMQPFIGLHIYYETYTMTWSYGYCIVYMILYNKLCLPNSVFIVWIHVSALLIHECWTFFKFESIECTHILYPVTYTAHIIRFYLFGGILCVRIYAKFVSPNSRKNNYVPFDNIYFDFVIGNC